MTEAILETQGLTKRFGELVAVDDVNLSVPEGEFRSVIGPNGAGKTTLFNLLSGALRSTEGRVLFKGEDVTSLAPYERVRKGIGRSFQITNIFGGLTVIENLRLAAQSVYDDGYSQIELLFRTADTLDQVNQTAERICAEIGLSTHAEIVAKNLDYGNRRRLEIGLVLATAPDIVLLDEPTAGMSVSETHQILELIDEVLADQTLILIEHDIELVMRISDTITVLNRGSILAEGTPDEVQADEAVQSAYLKGGSE